MNKQTDRQIDIQLVCGFFMLPCYLGWTSRSKATGTSARTGVLAMNDLLLKAMVSQTPMSKT